eukprot:752209-Hanusia_phi.AAC.1
MSTTYFKVHIRDVTASNVLNKKVCCVHDEGRGREEEGRNRQRLTLHSQGKIPDLHLKLAWDKEFKTVETEAGKVDGSGRISWDKTFGKGGVVFKYETKFANQLESKKFVIECWEKNFFSHDFIGKAELDLHTIATGPRKIKMIVKKGDGMPGGNLDVELEMMHSTYVKIELANVQVDLSRKKGFSMQYFCSLTSTRAKSIASHMPPPMRWQSLDSITIFASLEELCESFVVFEFSREESVLAVAQLPLVNILARMEEYREDTGYKFAVAVREFDQRRGERVIGSISGDVALRSLPFFSQLSEDAMLDDSGNVLGGHRLLPFSPLPAVLGSSGLKLPPRFSKEQLKKKEAPEESVENALAAGRSVLPVSEASLVL